MFHTDVFDYSHYGMHEPPVSTPMRKSIPVEPPRREIPKPVRPPKRGAMKLEQQPAVELEETAVIVKPHRKQHKARPGFTSDRVLHETAVPERQKGGSKKLDLSQDPTAKLQKMLKNAGHK